MLTATLKPKACQQCKREFMPARLMQAVCGPLCAGRKVRADNAAKAKAEKEQKRVDRETIPYLMAQADKAFCDWIRWRDRQAGHACISSGKPLNWAAGNQVDAGHYRSRGAASHLRYHPDNCHAQTKYENRHRAGNAVEYRIGLIARIGLARVEALESDNTPHKWGKDELRAIRDDYRARLKAMKEQT